MRDLASKIDLKRALSPVSVSDNTVQTTEILDLQGAMSATLALALGSIADADTTFTIVFYEGAASNMSDETAVADKDLIGTEALAAFQFDDDNECRKIGYVGSKRYVRAKITPANNASAALLSGVWITEVALAPAVNPPA